MTPDKKARYIVLFGPPGVGKGTQTKIVSDAVSLPSVSTGDIFRANLSANTELGQAAKQYLSAGELVPDDVTIKMVREYLEQPGYSKGVILDGFPRTLDQAEALIQMAVEFDARLNVIFIKVPEEIIVERISGRVICKDCGQVFHRKFNPPPSPPGNCEFGGQCDFYQRDDDRAEIVSNRILVYHEQTMPLLKFFEKKGLLDVLDGTQAIEDVTRNVLEILSEKTG